MKKAVTVLLAGATLLSGAVGLTACNANTEKNITVIAREKGSGTREAFDTVVTDGNGNYLEMKVDGKKVYNTTSTASELTKTSFVTSSVASDKNAIGYISLGSVDDSVKAIKVDGVAPTAETVLDGSYAIQRPFVIMTNATVTLTERAADFMNYLYSSEMESHAETAGCIFLAEPTKRANAGAEAIAVAEYTKREALPAGDKIVVRGSTSMEKLINEAAKGYADEYGADPTDIFDIQLEGSSVGRKAVEGDAKGNVIGLSSAAVAQDDIKSFNVCLDAVAVIVNTANEKINDLTIGQLYDIFTGKITKFSEIA